VVAAGVSVRRGWGWALRSVTLRMDGPAMGGRIVGIAASQQSAASAVIRLMAGLSRPCHGELRVLGEDLTTAGGRAAVRRQVGVARRPGTLRPARTVRGLARRAARRAAFPREDADVLAAAILDRLALTAWSDVPVRQAPAATGRRAMLAAAAVHEPSLILLDGLLDGLRPRDLPSLAAALRALAPRTTLIAAGLDTGALHQTCDEVLTLHPSTPHPPTPPPSLTGATGQPRWKTRPGSRRHVSTPPRL
jgi:ABC-type multidrug transport system ATPase subunit